MTSNSVVPRQGVTKIEPESGDFWWNDFSRSQYFVFGENDVQVILDLPENLTAAAISLAVMSSGAARMKTTVLLTPEEIDQAVKTPVDYQPPG